MSASTVSREQWRQTFPDRDEPSIWRGGRFHVMPTSDDVVQVFTSVAADYLVAHAPPDTQWAPPAGCRIERAIVVPGKALSLAAALNRALR